MENKEAKFPNNIRQHIKEIIGEKMKYDRIFRDEYLKEEIERYLASTRIQMILVSGIYKSDEQTAAREDFTLQMVKSIFYDDNVVYEDENIVLTMAFLIKELNTQFNEIADYYLPIEEYRKLALKAEAVYREKYKQTGIEGLKEVYDNFDVLLDEGVNKENLDKVSTSSNVQRELTNAILLNRRGIHLPEDPEDTEEYFYTQIAKSFEKEEKNNSYKRRYA